ncbi:MAG: hypothetical protein JJU02_16225 [Cryomorphaceae bacterium]|nr:hypothetical protein [Cryomorphaceae bacterium]
MSVHVFNQDEEGYIRHISKNPNHFVLNTYRSPTQNVKYGVIHRTICRSISPDIHDSGALTSRKYMKVCSDKYGELEAWFNQNKNEFITRVDF